MRETSPLDGLPRTLAVIGAAGMLGRALIARLAEPPLSGVALRCLDRVPYPESCPRPSIFTHQVADAHDSAALAACIEGADAVWVRAALLGGPKSIDVSICGDYLRQNTDLVATVLDGCDQAGCRRVYFDSTMTVFGQSTDQHPATPASEPAAHNFYAASKLVAEKLLRLWAHQGPALPPRSVQILRYARVRAAGTPDVIHHMVAAALAGQPIRVLGNSGHSFDFVHLDDIVAANLAALRRSPRFAIYHVSSDRAISLFDLAQRVRTWVAARTGITVPIVRSPGEVRYEPHVGALAWEESALELGLNMPRGLDDLIEEEIAHAQIANSPPNGSRPAAPLHRD